MAPLSSGGKGGKLKTTPSGGAAALTSPTSTSGGFGSGGGGGGGGGGAGTPADDAGAEAPASAPVPAPDGEEDDGSYHSEGSDCGDSDFEGIGGYKRGGYHPVHVGEVYNNRYTVLRKLGWGHFSTVWLCDDARTGEQVALKVQKSAEHYMEAAYDEIHILDTVSAAAAAEAAEVHAAWLHQREALEAEVAAEAAAGDAGEEGDDGKAVAERRAARAAFLAAPEPRFDTHVVRLVDHFEHTGPNGTHMCMVFETLGDNLLALIKAYRYRGIPNHMVRKLVRQVCIGLDFLHRVCHVIHTDLKPENVLLKEKLPPLPLPPEELEGCTEVEVEMTAEEVAAERDRERMQARKHGLRYRPGGPGGSPRKGGHPPGPTATAAAVAAAAAAPDLATEAALLAAVSGEERRKLRKRLKKKRAEVEAAKAADVTPADVAGAVDTMAPLLLLAANFTAAAAPVGHDARTAAGARELRLLAANGTPLTAAEPPRTAEASDSPAADADPAAAAPPAPTHADAAVEVVAAIDAMTPAAAGAPALAGAATAAISATPAFMYKGLAAALRRAIPLPRADDDDDEDEEEVVGSRASHVDRLADAAVVEASANLAAPAAGRRWLLTFQVPASGSGGGGGGGAPAAEKTSKKARARARAKAAKKAAAAAAAAGPRRVPVTVMLTQVASAAAGSLPADVATAVNSGMRAGGSAGGAPEGAGAAAGALALWQVAAPPHALPAVLRGLEAIMPHLAFLALPGFTTADAAQPAVLGALAPWTSTAPAADGAPLASLTSHAALVGVQLGGDGVSHHALALLKDAAAYTVTQASGATAHRKAFGACPALLRPLPCTVTPAASAAAPGVAEVVLPPFVALAPTGGAGGAGAGAGGDDSDDDDEPPAAAAAAGSGAAGATAQPPLVATAVQLRPLSHRCAAWFTAGLPAGAPAPGSVAGTMARSACAAVRAAACAAMDVRTGATAVSVAPVAAAVAAPVAAAAEAAVAPPAPPTPAKRMKKVKVPRVLSEEEKEAARARFEADFAAWEDRVAAMDCTVVDLGNACWTTKHFSEDIQTRQYRGPEVIIGAGYDTSADVWSLGCMVFELLTGDLLFDPQAGDSWSREEDHLAQIMELVGPLPRKMALSGKMSREYFNTRGTLRHIRDLRYWGPSSVLTEKYGYDPLDAAMVDSFMRPALAVDPRKRAPASLLVAHPWFLRDDAGEFVDFAANPTLAVELLEDMVERGLIPLPGTVPGSPSSPRGTGGGGGGGGGDDDGRAHDGGGDDTFERDSDGDADADGAGAGEEGDDAAAAGAAADAVDDWDEQELAMINDEAMTGEEEAAAHDAAVHFVETGYSPITAAAYAAELIRDQRRRLALYLRNHPELYDDIDGAGGGEDEGAVPDDGAASRRRAGAGIGGGGARGLDRDLAELGEEPSMELRPGDHGDSLAAMSASERAALSACSSCLPWRTSCRPTRQRPPP